MTSDIATLRLTTPVPPETRPEATVRACLRLPARSGEPFEEGGLRVQGLFKASRPEAALVSIVTVCRNVEQTLEAAMLSVFAQTWSNVEYIVVDGASNDGTLDLLRRHSGAIDYWVSELDTSLYQAMNKGLSLASGDFVLLLNADDTYVPTAVEELLRAKRYAGTSFVSAQATEIAPDGRPQRVMRSMPYDDAVRLRMPLRHETMLIPAAVYDAVGGYDPSYRISADFEFTVRLFEAGCTHYEIPRPLLNFRIDGLSNTNDARTAAERDRLIETCFPFLAEEDRALLGNRDSHGGDELLALAGRYPQQAAFVRSVHDYVEDNALNVRRKDRPWWAEQCDQLLAEMHRRRIAHRPKVSVVVAVFKGEDTLRQCLDSVLAQTLTEFELICVNDQSPDGSQAILEEYAGRDSRVVLVMNPVNIGHGATRNRGVRRARGAYVSHLDPDDRIPPNALQSLYAAATEHRSDLVRGAYRREQFHNGRIDHASAEVLHPMKEPRTIVNATVADLPELLKMPEGHWAFLYRAELARRVPYPEDLKMGQDGIFLCSILPAAGSITVIPDVVYHYLANADSAMNVFSPRKYLDVLEWRRRAMHMLADHGLAEYGLRLVENFARLGWHDQFRAHFEKTQDRATLELLGKALRAAYAEAGFAGIPSKVPDDKRIFLEHLLSDQVDEAAKDLLKRVAASGATEQPAGPPAAPPPAVSVILPFYRAERTIAEALDSALGQSLREIEVVCVDDLGGDGSAAIVAEYARKDPRVVVVQNAENLGHGASRNAGIRAARGAYVFHLDPDDLMPSKALERLLETAQRHGSEMVRGAYLHEQALLGEAQAKPVRKGLKAEDPPVVNTTLARSPGLLDSTEGHWSYLYRTEFARRVPYPVDLKMGQDSIFIVQALIAAKSITLTGDLAYHYRANPDSAMNRFTHRKFLDSVEWRRRAWHALSQAGQAPIGRRLLLAYWSPAFFRSLQAIEKPEELQEFTGRLREAFRQAGLGPSDLQPDRPAQKAIAELFASQPVDAPASAAAADAGITSTARPTPQSPPAEPVASPLAHAAHGKPLRIRTFVARDHGGAGTGTMRRVEALRSRGADADVLTLVKHSAQPYVQRLVPTRGPAAGADEDQVWNVVREQSIQPVRAVPGYRAQELFSLPAAVLDFRDLKTEFASADVLHFHWTVGMFDYAHAGETLADRPVVWTLADMNAFTGGCHYSEGCDGFQRECRECPLLGGSDLAHEAWKAKRAAYRQMKRVHVVCPSKWMAERVAASSLLGGRPVHVIPNAFPVDRLRPTNKVVARRRLGLPLERHLLLFGADSLANRRKGGGFLNDAITTIARRGGKNVEVIVFGNSAIDLPVPTHSMGHVADEERLALIYSAADAFVFPSLEDNAPLTVGEALLCGTPVVAFPVGNVPDLLRDRETGYIAKHRDAADLVRGIDWALDVDTKTAIRRSIRCRQSAAAYHDPKVAAERHLEVYREAMSHA